MHMNLKVCSQSTSFGDWPHQEAQLHGLQGMAAAYIHTFEITFLNSVSFLSSSQASVADVVVPSQPVHLAEPHEHFVRELMADSYR